MKKHIYLIITISFFCYTKISAQIKVLNKPNIVANTEVMQKPTVPVKNSQVQKLPTASQKINPEHLGIYKSSISINGKKIPINIKGKGTVLSPNKYPNFVEKNINSKEKRVGLTEEEEKETYTKICKTTFNKLDVNSSEWDVISLSTINNVKVGSVFSLLDLQNEGKFLNIHGVRNPATVIVDAENITKPLIELNQPTENDIINAKAQLLNTNGHTIPNVKERTVISEIYDESVLKLHVGFDVISPSVSVKGMFDFSTNSKTEKFLMDYKAEAFTLGYIPKTTTFFQDQNLNDRSDLVYVDKLVYGTRILVAFETDFSNIDFGAKLEAEV
ncbi:MAG: hypothetical protein KA319_11200 [Ferruginibacter sp.]|nr:hypothetical protein [Ferruginibacter sp.]